METKFAKIATSQPADLSLERMLEKVNDGFRGGRVSKLELASWIVTHFETHLFEATIPDIRQAHFEEIAYLESLLKEVKASRRPGHPANNLASLLEPITSRAQDKKLVTLTDPHRDGTLDSKPRGGKP